MKLSDIESSILEEKTDILKIVRSEVDRLERHITPVFSYSEKGEIFPAGSGVFARLGDRFYLISVAHVFDHCTYGVHCPRSKGIIEPLKNNIIVSGKPVGGTRKDDRVDIGFVRLTKEETVDFGMERMLNLNEIGGLSLRIDTTLFVAIGYPLRDCTIDKPENSIQSAITSFTTGIADERAHHLAKMDKNSHFLLRLDHRCIVTNKSYGSQPRMNGMSGGGVWPVRIDVESVEKRVPFFGGLIIEKPKGFESAISVARGLLVKYFIERFDEE